jgi:hypothetical protein
MRRLGAGYQDYRPKSPRPGHSLTATQMSEMDRIEAAAIEKEFCHAENPDLSKSYDNLAKNS